MLLVIAGMYALNAVAGKLTMPRPDAVLQQSIKMWSDGTMLKALLESLTVLGLGFLLSVVTGIGVGALLNHVLILPGGSVPDSLRTRPIRRPAKGALRQQAELCCLLDPKSLRGGCGFPRPTELGAVPPHPMHDHR